MKHRIGAILAILIVCSAPPAARPQTDSAAAPTGENAYQAIVTRNAFALIPIPVAAKTEAAPPATAVDVFITGITTLSGVRKVLLQVAEKGKQPDYLPPLVEGDGQGRVEVVSIDPEKGLAVIKLDGNEKTLSLEKDSPKPGAAAGPAGVPGKPVMPNPAGTIPLPGVISARGAAAAVTSGGAVGKMGVMTGGGGSSIPSPTTPAAGAGAVGVGTSSALTAGTSASLPSRPLRADSSGVYVGGAGSSASGANAANAGSTAAAPGMTREQAVAHIADQQNLYDEAVRLGLMPKRQVPPLPIPPGMSGRTGGAAPAPTPNPAPAGP